MLEGNAGRTCGGSRDTELANDPDMRSETDFLDALGDRVIRKIKMTTEQGGMKTQEQIIKNSVNSIFLKGLIKAKGWTKSQAAEHIAAFLHCGQAISFGDFMEAQA